MAYDPFAVIRQFWGEDLSPSLIRRMVQAPEDHYEAFSDEYFSSSPGLGPLPSLPAAHTRPVLTSSATDLFRRGGEVFREAPLLLLYTHEVVVTFPAFGVVSPDLQDREATLKWLLSVQPLFQMGIVHIRADDSAKRHPALAYRANEAEKVAQELASDPASSVARFCNQWAELDEESPDGTPSSTDEPNPILWWLALDAVAHKDHEARYGREAHRLFKSQAELDLWLALGGRTATLQERTQARLVSLELPKFAQAIPELIAIRTSSEAFADWREALGAAIARAAPDNQIETSTELRRDLADQLAPFAERIDRETKRSSALASLRVGAKEFGLGAVAATAGFAVGGSLKTALATGGTVNAMKAALDFQRRRAQASRDAALGKLALLFFDD